MLGFDAIGRQALGQITSLRTFTLTASAYAFVLSGQAALFQIVARRLARRTAQVGGEPLGEHQRCRFGKGLDEALGHRPGCEAGEDRKSVV